MKSLQHSDPVFEQKFSNIPTEISQTFTIEQLEAIRRVFSYRSWNRHPIDIRVSVPILGVCFYMMLLVGRERRAKERLRVYIKNFLYTPINISFIIGFLLILLTSGVTTLSFIFSSLSSLSISSHPTSLPFIKSQIICERTGRIWRDRKCWDSEHNPLF